MKNKTKKILAGACLGLAGMGCLTGCSEMGFSESQVEKIESLIETGDTFMKDSKDLMEEIKDGNTSFQQDLLEEIKKQDNTQLQEELLAELKKQNSKVDRAEAAMIVNQATRKLLINSGDIWANMKMTVNISQRDVGFGGTLNSFKDSEGRYIFYLNEEDEFFNACWAGGLFERCQRIELPESTETLLSWSPSNYMELVRQYLISDMCPFFEGYFFEENVVSAKINEDGNYEIVAMFDTNYMEALPAIGVLTTIVDPNGNLLSYHMEMLNGDSMEVSSFSVFNYTFTYGDLEEDSVYELLGVTSDDLKYWEE